MHIQRVTRMPTFANENIVDLHRRALESSMRFILSAQVAEIWEFDLRQHIRISARMGTECAFRQLCVPRRLLEIPGHDRHIFWDCAQMKASFTMPYATEILVAPFECCSGHNGLLLVVTCAVSLLDPKNMIFLSNLGAALRTAASCIRLRENRATSRKHTLEHIALMCICPLSSMQELYANIFSKLMRCLPASHPSVGLLQLGGDYIDIRGFGERRVDRSSIFECLPPMLADSVTLNDSFGYKENPLQRGSRIQVKYGNVWYTAVIQENKGHLHFDVKYDLKDWMGRHEKEASVSILRIRHKLVDFHDHLPQSLANAFVTTKRQIWPVLIAPLSCTKGVICLDSWSNLNPEPGHDEVHVMIFLKKVGSHLGKAIDNKAKGASLRYLRSLASQTSLTSHMEIKNTFVSQFRTCVTFSRHIELQEAINLRRVENGASDMLRRSHQMFSHTGFTPTNMAVQANTPYTFFLLVFEDCKVVIDDDNVPMLVKPHLCLSFWF